MSTIAKEGSYAFVLGAVQYILQHRFCPPHTDGKIASALNDAKSAYRLIDSSLIVPISSEEEASAVTQAFTDLKSAAYDGARNHLAAAATAITKGAWADSVRESIHAVESVAKMLAPGQETLTPALAVLAKAGHIHPALKDGMAKLYGYTSDEKGIRHALLEDGDAKVDEIDALYIFGACAAFVSYLVNKGAAAGLVGK